MIPLDSIICGRAEEVLAGFPDACIDLTVTSPPYDGLRTYNGYTFDFDTIARQLYRVTKPGGVVVWVVGDETRDGSESGTSFRQALGFMEIGFKLHDTMIYHRESQPRQSTRYEQHFEYMFVLSKGQPKTYNLITIPCVQAGWSKVRTTRDNNQDALVRSRNIVSEMKIKGNVWRYTVGGYGTESDHPATFPERLAEDHILSWSNAGDLVLDPMCGSGTTCKMAIRHHRHFIGIDISEAYCALARRRISAVQTTLL